MAIEKLDLARFASWLEKKDPAKEYRWVEREESPLLLYAAAIGDKPLFMALRKGVSIRETFGRPVFLILWEEPRTYGGAAARARATVGGQVVRR